MNSAGGAKREEGKREVAGILAFKSSHLQDTAPGDGGSGTSAFLAALAVPQLHPSPHCSLKAPNLLSREQKS